MTTNNLLKWGILALFISLTAALFTNTFNRKQKQSNKNDSLGIRKLDDFLTQSDQEDYKIAEDAVLDVLNKGNVMTGVAILKDQVLVKNPDNEIALYYLGLWSIQSGQLIKAKEKFEKLIFLHPQKLIYQQKLLEINKSLEVSN